MGHEHMCCKAAVNSRAEMPRRLADVFIARLAGGALSATDPGIDRDLRADFGFCIRSRLFNHAGDFVSERKGQSATGAYVERFAVAQFKKSVLHVQIGMADAASRNPHQYFAALRARRVDHRLAQRCAVGRQ